MFVRFDLAFRNCDSSLIATDLQIGVGSVSGDDNTSADPVRLSSLHFISSGRCIMPNPARHVELPACGRSNCVFVNVPSKSWVIAGNLTQISLETLVLGGCGGVEFSSREQSRTGPQSNSPRLVDSFERCGEIKILIQSPLHNR